MGQSGFNYSKETIPALTRVAVLCHEYTPTIGKGVDKVKAVASSLSIEVKVLKVETPEQFGAAFAEASRDHVQAM